MAIRPLEALQYAIDHAFVVSGRKPGFVIQSLPAEHRTALESLTSDDVKAARPFPKTEPRWKSPSA